MHPSGFDTRAVTSDEVATFLGIAYGTGASSADERVRDILDANSFLQKINFIREVMKGWVKQGRLGGRPTHDKASGAATPMELFWEGSQERAAGGSGSKFVWVTVGAPGGDGEYRSVSLRERRSDAEEDREADALRERLRMLGRPL